MAIQKPIHATPLVDNPMNNGDKVLEGEVILPGKTEPELPPMKRTKLRTPGNIKSEMGRVYRQAKSKHISDDVARSRIWMLSQLLKATEVELEHNLETEDPDADRPAMVGLAITGPKPAIQGPSRADRLDGTVGKNED